MITRFSPRRPVRRSPAAIGCAAGHLVIAVDDHVLEEIARRRRQVAVEQADSLFGSISVAKNAGNSRSG